MRRAVEVGCWDVGGLLLGVTKGVGEGTSQVSSWATAEGRFNHRCNVVQDTKVW